MASGDEHPVRRRASPTEERAQVEIYHVYANTRHLEQTETWKWCEWARDNLPVAIIDREVDSDTEYSTVVSDALDTGRPFFLLEQDIVPSERLFWAMVNCDHPIEVSQYMLYPSSTALGEPVQGNRIVVGKATFTSAATFDAMRWTVGEEEYCDYFSLGFTLFRYPQKLTKIIGPLIRGKVHYIYLDHAISTACWRLGIAAHIHKDPIIHNHGREQWEADVLIGGGGKNEMD